MQSPSGSFLLVFDIEKLPAGMYKVYAAGDKNNWNIGFVKN
jgi:hypothetical protein